MSLLNTDKNSNTEYSLEFAARSASTAVRHLRNADFKK